MKNPSVISSVKNGRTWSSLEEALLIAAKRGDFAKLVDSTTCTDDRPEERRVRTALIRYLLLGGSSDRDGVITHRKGVYLSGAWIDGVLDLQGCHTELECQFDQCLFESKICLRDAKIRGLQISGGRAEEEIDLLRITTDASILFINSFVSQRTINLRGAHMGMQLNCGGATFSAGNSVEGGRALDCTGAKIGADALLVERSPKNTSSDPQRTIFNGMVDFAHAKISGHLRVEGVELNGIFRAEGMRVEDGFHWKKITGNPTRIDLRHARVGILNDDCESWGGKKTLLHLSGLSYETIVEKSTVEERKSWLARNVNTDWDRTKKEYAEFPQEMEVFHPQPYSQLATALAKQGLRADAAKLRCERDKLSSIQQLKTAISKRNKIWPIPSLIAPSAKRGLDILFEVAFGFGHLPMRGLFMFFVLWIAAFCIFQNVYDAGQMAPNSPIVLTSTDWLASFELSEVCGGQPIWYWLGTEFLRPMSSSIDYETFSPFLYSLDLLLPLDAIGQEKAWSPSYARGSWGYWGFWTKWIFQVVGWIIAIVGAAVLTGLIGRNDN